MSASPLRWFGWACLMACSSANARPPVYVRSDILPVVNDREKTWTQARTPLELNAGQASNCSSYARLKPSGIRDEGHNQLVKSEYQICDVLAQLDKSAKLEPLSATNYGAALASRLDLRTFRSSLRPRMDEDDDTLSSLFGGEVRIEREAAVVENQDRFFSLTVVVVGDFDQSGVTDWLVWVSDEIPAGTFRAYQTLLIKDVPPDGLLRAESL